MPTIGVRHQKMSTSMKDGYETRLAPLDWATIVATAPSHSASDAPARAKMTPLPAATW
jgi:hypothetical protein